MIATKVYHAMRPDPNGKGLSRKAIMGEIDASLKRLGTDHVDLYQIHRWDYETPIEETLEALHDVVKMGKARYIGASSMHAWQFCKALYLADLHGWTRFVSMQNHYNLLYREEEREMMGLCAAERVGVIPWSPLARGRLTRPWDQKRQHRTSRHGRVRQETLRPDRRGRPTDRRTGTGSSPRTGATARASRTGVGSRQAVRHLTDHRCNQAQSPGRRSGRFIGQADESGSGSVGRALCTSSGDRVFMMLARQRFPESARPARVSGRVSHFALLSMEPDQTVEPLPASESVVVTPSADQ